MCTATQTGITAENLIRGMFVFRQQLELKYLKQNTVVKMGSAL